MSSTGYEIILIIMLILANGVFAMSEIAMVSARKARLQQRAAEGDMGAKAALELAEAPNRFLSTIQMGMSLISILVGAFSGATMAGHLSAVLRQVAFLAPYADALALILVVLVVTYFSLVLGELIPKRLGLNNPERVAAVVGRPMKTVARLAAPVVHILSLSTELGLRLLGAHPSTDPPITQEEIKVLMAQGTQIGVFEEAEQDMVESVFRLGERRVDAIMTPRTEVVWLNQDDPVPDILQTVLESHYSIFPVAQGNLDNVTGILVARELLACQLTNEPLELKTILKPPLFVPESTPALKALELLRTSRNHIALVIDEYGGFQGIVTLYDILEAIVGDVPSAGEPVEPQAVQREDGSWLFDGTLQIDEFKEILELDDLPDEDRAGYQTLGGFVMTQMGNIPTAGQHFEWEGWRFEVVDMDGRRVDKVLVYNLPVK
jgi:putative hemolysin